MVILDHGVAEESEARFIQLFFGSIFVAMGQLDLKILAHMHTLNAAVSQMFERILDGFALRIEHGLFRGHHDLSFHRSVGSIARNRGHVVGNGDQEASFFTDAVDAVARPLTKSSPERGCVEVEGHQPQFPRSFRVLRLVFDTAALREDDFVNGLGRCRSQVEEVPGLES